MLALSVLSKVILTLILNPNSNPIVKAPSVKEELLYPGSLKNLFLALKRGEERGLVEPQFKLSLANVIVNLQNRDQDQDQDLDQDVFLEEGVMSALFKMIQDENQGTRLLTR